MLEASFRIHRDEVTRTLIGCPPTAERQKIGLGPIATERRLRRNGRWKRQRRNGFFSRKQRNSYGAYVILNFLRNLRNGNRETATAERQRNGGNQALKTDPLLTAITVGSRSSTDDSSCDGLCIIGHGIIGGLLIYLYCERDVTGTLPFKRPLHAAMYVILLRYSKSL